MLLALVFLTPITYCSGDDPLPVYSPPSRSILDLLYPSQEELSGDLPSRLPPCLHVLPLVDWNQVGGWRTMWVSSMLLYQAVLHVVPWNFSTYTPCPVEPMVKGITIYLSLSISSKRCSVPMHLTLKWVWFWVGWNHSFIMGCVQVTEHCC